MAVDSFYEPSKYLWQITETDITSQAQMMLTCQFRGASSAEPSKDQQFRWACIFLLYNLNSDHLVHAFESLKDEFDWQQEALALAVEKSEPAVFTPITTIGRIESPPFAPIEL